MEVKDEDLMVRLKQGDGVASDLLVKRYQNTLYGFIYRLLINQNDTDDIFQETWIRVIKYGKSFQVEKKFSTWLFQIALNCVRDFLRKKNKLILEDNVIENIEIQEDKSYNTFENKEIAQKLMEKLPLYQREVIVLRFFHSMKEIEIANVLEIPLGTVKSRLHKAMKYLKSHYHKLDSTKNGE